MDHNAASITQLHIEETLKNLKKNQMNGYYAKDQAALMAILEDLCANKGTAAVGGSMTLKETGVLDWIRSEFDFFDRYAEGLTKKETNDIHKKSFAADYYFTSTNALTVKGELVNIDGNGNRVAAMIYGPDKVIVIAGTNKLVQDEAAAYDRIRNFASPANCVRLNRKTPCAKTGHCMDCTSPDRICASYATLRWQTNPDRVHVILVNESLGY